MPQRARHNTQTGQQAIKGSRGSSQTSRRRLYPSRCGYLLGRAGERLSRAKYGLSGKVLFWAALRLPYPLGTLCHHEGQALGMRQQHRAAGYLLQILRRVASALTESRRSLYPTRCGYLLGRAGKTLPEGLKTGNFGKFTRKMQKILLKIL